MLIDSGHQIGRTVAISNVFWILRKYLDSSAGRYKFPDNGNVVIVLFIWCVCIDFSDFRAASDCTYFVIPFESIVVWLTVYPSVKIISIFFQLINRKKFKVGLKLVQEKKNEKRNVKCQFIFCAVVDPYVEWIDFKCGVYTYTAPDYCRKAMEIAGKNRLRYQQCRPKWWEDCSRPPRQATSTLGRVGFHCPGLKMFPR